VAVERVVAVEVVQVVQVLVIVAVRVLAIRLAQAVLLVEGLAQEHVKADVVLLVTWTAVLVVVMAVGQLVLGMGVLHVLTLVRAVV